MVANIIAIIMMALGVASGTKASSNTFYDEYKKPQVKRATENFSITEGFYKGTTTTYKQSGVTVQNTTKYYIDDNNSNYYNNIVNISNTLYKFDEWRPSQQITEYKQVLIINNYYNSRITFDLQNRVDMVSGYGYNGAYTTYKVNNIYNQYINMSLTSNTMAQVLTDMHNTLINDSVVLNGDTYDFVSNQNQNYYVDATTTQLVLEPNETIMLYMYSYVRTGSGTAGALGGAPTEFAMRGYVLIPENTYEVVDIPGIMFTVLTMPFSFISTAFNLTIFPGTPYQVNFANLFMVVLATFVLLWLIKKVFK